MEILAHISAKTSNQNDQQYRRQARGYIAFESNKRQRLSYPQSSSESAGSSQGLDVRDFAYIDDTQLAISALESQIITSSLQRALQDSEGSHGVSQPLSSPSKADAPACHGRDERPNNHAFRSPNSTEVSTQRLVHEVHSQTDLSIEVPRQISHSSEVPGIKAATGAQEAGDLPDPAPQTGPTTHPAHRGSNSWSDDGVPVELPSTYSISDGTSKGSNTNQSHSLEPLRTPVRSRRKQILFKTPEQLGKKPMRPPSTLGSISPEVVRATPSKPMPPKFPISERSGLGVSPQERSDFSAACGTSKQAQIQPQTYNRARTVNKSSQIWNGSASIPQTAEALPPLSLSIMPPPASVSTQPEPSTFITPNFRTMKGNEDIKDRYAPKHVTRAIRPRERGYWIFTPQWTPQIERYFWTFMSQVIEVGNAGWGVWCVRTPEQAVDEEGRPVERLGQVRVFCWGEVIEHVYLMLYISSRNHIRKANPVWCDASGKVVIRIKDGDPDSRMSLEKD
ncbi:hypothetical protein KVT40_001047 [Elsinoe batatas]|uniref:Uncharacterized protein n=1 Tax=Elsinoe batatas TaxID=2601811 RepID=A0A8K0PKV3_9PEZI|nr:hypothetical protein KVT40_001047 [Elsinoe batatas]